MPVPKWVKNLSDNDRKNLREVTLGLVHLEGEGLKDGLPLRRKAILCRSGSWEGMYGPVEVTKEKLDAIAGKYNRTRANAINANDYIPILVDHERKADLTKGRLDISQVLLEVVEMPDPDSGDDEWALIGELRVDEDDAKKKVLAGVYAQLSISFNEDTFDLYEVSFVAVEAARRSIALSGQGDNNVDLKQSQKKISSLQLLIADGNKGRAALAQVMNTSIADTEKVLSAHRASITEAISSLKTASVTATFKKIVAEGRLSKAEFDKLKLNDFAEMNETALKSVIQAYESRPVSTSFSQSGVSGQQPIGDDLVKDLDKESMKKQMELQRKGESGTMSLKAAPAVIEEEDLAGEEEEESDNDSAKAPSFSDVEEIIEKLKGLESDVKKFDELTKSLKETLGKLQAEDNVEPQGEE